MNVLQLALPGLESQPRRRAPYSPLGERLHVQRLIPEYTWLCSQPTATPEDRRFLARLRGRLGELTGQRSEVAA